MRPMPANCPRCSSAAMPCWPGSMRCSPESTAWPRGPTGNCSAAMTTRTAKTRCCPRCAPARGASGAQLDGLLADTRASLGRVDAVLQEAQAIGANAREATTDLGALRAQVQSNLSKLEGLINQIGRQWPFARDTELSLP